MGTLLGYITTDGDADWGVPVWGRGLVNRRALLCNLLPRECLVPALAVSVPSKELCNPGSHLQVLPLKDFSAVIMLPKGLA